MADLREAWNKVRAHVAVGASISGVTRREALMALDEMLDVIPEYAALLAPRQPEVCGTCGGSGVIGTGMPDESGEQEELTSCPHCDGPAPARPPEPPPKRTAHPLTGDALKDACRRLSPPPALEDMDIATPEEAATGTEPMPIGHCRRCGGPAYTEEGFCGFCGDRTGIRREGGPSEGKWIEGTSGKEE